MPSDPRLRILPAAALYAAVLVAAAAAHTPILLGLALVAVALATWTVSSSNHVAARAAATWVALHAVVLASGGVRSPLLVLAAGWIVWVGAMRPAWQRQAAGAALAMLLGAELLTPDAYDLRGALSAVLLAGFAALVAPARRRAEREPGAPAPDDRTAARDPATPRTGAADRLLLEEACEVVRRATGAQEATLWRADGAGRVWLVARAADASGDAEAGEDEVPLEGHPFGWPLQEGMHIRLERGRRALPTAWAQEMLLLPIAAPEGLIALAYRDAAPGDAEAAALRSQTHVSSLLALLAERATSRLAQRRIDALTAAVHTLPGELQLQEFGARLARAARDSTAADGAALVLWHDEAAAAEVLHVDAPGLAHGAGPGQRAGEGSARVTLSAKHGVLLTYDDLRRERDAIPLLAPGEQWSEAPRSAVLAPLVDGERTLGVVAAWSAAPAHFGAREVEFLRVLCSVAAPPLRGARQFEALDRQASTDALTGLPNRRSFEARHSAEASQFSRYARPFSLLVLDVDHFKRFNDTWGHEAGDRVLQHVGHLLRASVREVDLPARLGGEEFVALMPETSLGEAMEAAERVRRTIEQGSVVWNGRPLNVTASIGVAACPDCTLDPDRLLPLADAALYAAKAAGRNRVAPAPCSDPAGT